MIETKGCEERPHWPTCWPQNRRVIKTGLVWAQPCSQKRLGIDTARSLSHPNPVNRQSADVVALDGCLAARCQRVVPSAAEAKHGLLDHVG